MILMNNRGIYTRLHKENIGVRRIRGGQIRPGEQIRSLFLVRSPTEAERAAATMVAEAGAAVLLAAP